MRLRSRKSGERNPNTCDKCPQRFDPAGCQWWIEPSWGIVETNGEETRLLSGCCGIPHLFRLQAYVIGASNRPAAAVESARNEIARIRDEILGGVTGMARACQAILQRSEQHLELSAPQKLDELPAPKGE